MSKFRADIVICKERRALRLLAPWSVILRSGIQSRRTKEPTFTLYPDSAANKLSEIDQVERQIVKLQGIQALLRFLQGRISGRFIRFFLVGCICASVSFGLRILLMSWLSYGSAIAVSYVVGMVIAFLLNRRYVFSDFTNLLHNQIFWYLAVNAFALAQTLGISILLGDYLFPAIGLSWHAREISHVIGIAAPVISSYAGHKYFSFSRVA